MIYTRWLHWNITRFCNLSCDYCFSYSPYKKGEIVNIDISKVIENLSSFNETFRISFTGGEPFLVKNILDLCHKLSENHYLSFNTNLTHPSIKQFANLIDPKKVIKIDASFHYAELIKNNLLKRYIENYKLLVNKGFLVNSEQVAYPPLLKLKDEISRVSIENNLKIKYVPFFGKFDGIVYPQAYTEKEISIFNLDLSILEKFDQKDQFCNAGYNAAVVFSNGNIKPCFQIKENICNIYDEVRFNAEPIFKCKSKICGCPMNVYDSFLYKLAKEKFI